MKEKRSVTRIERARALIMRGERCLVDGFALHNPPFRFLALEIDLGGMFVEAQEAETLPEIAKLLEGSDIEGTDTEIHDLDTGNVLRPDFERIFRVPRIYHGRTIVYEVFSEIAATTDVNSKQFE